jgi:hypothetical protein
VFTSGTYFGLASVFLEIRNPASHVARGACDVFCVAKKVNVAGGPIYTRSSDGDSTCVSSPRFTQDLDALLADFPEVRERLTIEASARLKVRCGSLPFAHSCPRPRPRPHAHAQSLSVASRVHRR